MDRLAQANARYFDQLYSKSIATELVFNYALRTKIVLHLLRKHAVRVTNIRILDLGFGFGYLSLLFGPTNEVTGIDISRAALTRFRKVLVEKGYVRFNLLRANLNQGIPVKGPFDLVLASHVIEHLQDPANFCVELSRVVKKSGHLLIILPLHERDQGGLHSHDAQPEEMMAVLERKFTIISQKTGFNCMALTEWIRPKKLSNPAYYVVARMVHVLLSITPLFLLDQLSGFLDFLKIPPKQTVVLLRRK